MAGETCGMLWTRRGNLRTKNAEERRLTAAQELAKETTDSKAAKTIHKCGWSLSVPNFYIIRQKRILGSGFQEAGQRGEKTASDLSDPFN